MQLSQVTQNGLLDDVTVPSLSDQTVCVRKMMADCVVIVCVLSPWQRSGDGGDRKIVIIINSGCRRRTNSS